MNTLHHVCTTARWIVRLTGLAFLAALGLTAVPVSAEELQIGGTGGALPVMRLVGDAFTRVHPAVTVAIVPSLGSGGGIKAALDGAISMAVSSRPLQPGEVAHGAVA
ncbi:MAG TPA: substrate-binding domain-containing protein, partial [Burkholderiales bacterium]|nr:substrate-binding domain-containing protein [Burkholderiales bacterium]